MKTAFVTDSGTGKTVAELAKDGIYSIPLQVSYDNKNYQDLEELGIDQVYDLMSQGVMLSTSLPSLGRIEELFESLKNEGYERIFAVPICSGLSGTINAMELSARNVGLAFEYVDCHVTAVVQEYMIKAAKALDEEGKSMDEIKDVLNRIVDATETFIIPTDLQHLKRGGRLTPLAAALGGLLRIKPILQINKSTNGKIDVFDKVRTMHKAMDVVINHVKEKNKVDENYFITIAHADDEKEAEVYIKKVKEAFPNAETQVIKLVSVVGVHTGKGCQAIQFFPMLRK